MSLIRQTRLVLVEMRSLNQPILLSPKVHLSRLLHYADSIAAVTDAAKDKMCRNLYIYGYCKYEGKGCAFRHDRVCVYNIHTDPVKNKPEPPVLGVEKYLSRLWQVNNVSGLHRRLFESTLLRSIRGLRRQQRIYLKPLRMRPFLCLETKALHKRFIKLMLQLFHLPHFRIRAFLHQTHQA